MIGTMIKHISFFVLLFLLTSHLAFGQQDDYITIVKLKDGSVFEGQLKEYVDGEYIRMDVGENQITIKQSSIKYIKHKNLGAIKAYSFNERGLYHHSSIGFLPGFISAGNPVLGIGIDHSSGFMFSRLLGAGLNLGVHNYDPSSKEVFYTLSAEMRGYLMPKNFSPYYVLRAGYGFTHAGQTFLEANGGFEANPALGLRFTGNGGANLTAEIGMMFQNAYFKEQTEWWDRSILEKDVRYQRFNLKIGILF